MESIKLWISGVCIVSLMIAILKAIIPDSVSGKIFNITSSLILVLAIIAPIKTVHLELDAPYIHRNDETVAEIIEKALDENAKLTDSIIEDELCEYICTTANLKRSDISVTCKDGEIEKVVLYAKDPCAIEVLKEKCGITNVTVIERRD